MVRNCLIRLVKLCYASVLGLFSYVIVFIKSIGFLFRIEELVRDTDLKFGRGVGHIVSKNCFKYLRQILTSSLSKGDKTFNQLNLRVGIQLIYVSLCG